MSNTDSDQYWCINCGLTFQKTIEAANHEDKSNHETVEIGGANDPRPDTEIQEVHYG